MNTFIAKKLEEFDKEFENAKIVNDALHEWQVYDDIKSFFQSSLEQQKEEVVKKLRRLQILADEEQAFKTDIAIQKAIKILTNK